MPDRVGVVHYYPRGLVGDGGVSQLVRGWAVAIAQLGVPSRLVVDGTLPADGRLHRRLVESGVRVHSARHIGPRRLKGLADVSVLRPPGNWVTVLHSVYSWHNYRAGRGLRATRTPYIVAPHGGYGPVRGRMNRASKQLASLPESWVRAGALGVWTSTSSENIGNSPESARLVVPPGIHPSTAKQWSGGGGYVAWLGRYDTVVKGLDLLLSGLRDIDPGQRPRVRLHGRDSVDTQADVRRVVDRMGLSPWVAVGGPLNDREKADFFARCDVAVLPSRAESLSLALLEAMALGTPCFVSASADLASEIERAEAARLVAASPGAWRDALAGVTTADPSLGARGKKWVEEEFSWQVNADRFVTALERRLSDGR